MEVFRPRGFDCRYDILPFTREELDWMQWGCDYDAYYYHTEAECQYAFRWIQRWDIDPIPQEPTCSDYVDHAIAEEIGNERVARTAECMRTHPFWDGCFCGHPGDGC